MDTVVAQANGKTAGPAEPTVFVIAYQSAPFDVATAAVNDVAFAYKVAT
jgi:hypothetical protein